MRISWFLAIGPVLYSSCNTPLVPPWPALARPRWPSAFPPPPRPESCPRCLAPKTRSCCSAFRGSAQGYRTVSIQLTPWLLVHDTSFLVFDLNMRTESQEKTTKTNKTFSRHSPNTKIHQHNEKMSHESAKNRQAFAARAFSTPTCFGLYLFFSAPLTQRILSDTMYDK